MIADMVRYVRGNMPLDADMVRIYIGMSGLGFAGCKDELVKETYLYSKSFVVSFAPFVF